MKLKLYQLVCLALFFAVTGTLNVAAQGCVAIRPMSCGGTDFSNVAGLFGKGEWRVSASYRYFKSHRHFRGDSEEEERIENGTEVINLANSVELGVSHSISNRFSLAVNLPVIFYDRSSLYEHYGNSTNSNPDQLRFHTGAKGIGDMRISGNYWLFNPMQGSGNISVGLGLKLPTGNSNVNDDFHKLNSEGLDSLVNKPVDQSIQLGDGGWGITLEAQAFQSISTRSMLYFSGFYMFNPQNVNKTLTRGTLDNVDPLIAYHSIADQYAVRLGINYMALPQQNLSVSLGGRIEGIPAEDAFGKSEGFRRPGYVISAEPGLFYTLGSLNFNLSVPVALYRNRVKSVYDLADPNGNRHGDAAFADYSINAGVLWRFGGHHTASMEDVPKFKNTSN
ncbi:MAG: transporter [Saprospiraceae bacterium]|nr:transporter [Saprospiraceae bacterium]